MTTGAETSGQSTDAAVSKVLANVHSVCGSLASTETCPLAAYPRWSA